MENGRKKKVNGWAKCFLESRVPEPICTLRVLCFQADLPEEIQVQMHLDQLAYQIPWQVPLKILAAGPADDYSLLNYLYVLTVCKLLLMWVELLITRQAGSQSREKSEQFISFGSVSTAAPSFEAGAHFMNGLLWPRLAMVSPDFWLPLALAKIAWAKCQPAQKTI